MLLYTVILVVKKVDIKGDRFIMNDNEFSINKLEKAIKINEKIEKMNSGGYILRLDIDNLRGINATKGNTHGDEVIAKAYACIQSVISGHQNLYWLSGGDFLVISTSNNSEKEAQELYNRIQKAVMEMIIKNKYEFYFSLCCGIVLVEANSDISYSEIAKRSEFALASAKDKGINVCSVFYKNHYKESIMNHNLKIALQKAVNEEFEGFKVLFQPIVNIDGKVTGAESLIRFIKDGTCISPSTVIPLLEETGLIVPVGNWMLKNALAFCKKASLIKDDFIVSINMSYMEARDYNKLSMILHALEAYEVNPKNLAIELTESGFLESSKSIKRLWEGLSEVGVKVCLDDFGTGFSNFHYIEELDPDLLKVDNTIVRDAMDNAKNFKILEAIGQLTKFLDLTLCVEGIENEEYFSKMKGLNAEFYQGYYFGKPCEGNEFLKKFL